MHAPFSTRGTRRLLPALILLAFAPPAWSGPWLSPGDAALRHDIQVLADAGVIGSPVGTWPLSWGDISAALDRPVEELDEAEFAALTRLRRRAGIERRVRTWSADAEAWLGTEPRIVREFQSTPREEAGVGFALEWTGERTALRLSGQAVSDPEDDREWRADGSYIGLALGNWMFAGAITDRWWGPGWQGSLILSDNARPIPAFTIERNSTAPFRTKWLRWIGHWDAVAMWGFLEADRAVPDARYFGMRLTARPTRFLELGVSRTATWCGDGRPCGFDTFNDLLLGRDNAGENVAPEDEPGNQLGGYDIRVSAAPLGYNVAAWTQRIGEDEQDLRPSLFLTQFGVETWGSIGAAGWRLYLEVADTLCGGNITGDGPANCAYNHPIYATGMRYRGRSIGHSFDNDAEIWTLGAVLNEADGHGWTLSLAAGDLNRAGAPDPANSITPVEAKYRSGQLTHHRRLRFGELRAGVGVESLEPVDGGRDEDWRLFIHWRHAL